MVQQQNTFYTMIPPIHSIREITNAIHYFDVPADWHVALTDVRGSTRAIEEGRYKDVNAVAAASITALLNHLPGIDIPYVFGGDGATILIPPSILKEAGESLLATRRMADEQFNLELRVGIIPVSDILRDGYRIRVARLKMSDNFQQAIFSGGGLAHAERLLKHPERGKAYEVPASTGFYQADFSGFECRWNEIRSTHDETVCLIIQAVQGGADTHNAIYLDALEHIEMIYGDSANRHPISIGNMKLALNPGKLQVEAKIRYQDNSLGRRLNLLKGSIKALIAMRFNIGQWGNYKEIFLGATDHEKFDDTLRMAISGTSDQRAVLRAYLEGARLRGDLVYGMHVSTHTLVTCIVFDYFGRQVHFVDGANGGYALAAKEMKAQLKELGG